MISNAEVDRLARKDAPRCAAAAAPRTKRRCVLSRVRFQFATEVYFAANDHVIWARGVAPSRLNQLLHSCSGNGFPRTAASHYLCRKAAVPLSTQLQSFRFASHVGLLRRSAYSRKADLGFSDNRRQRSRHEDRLSGRAQPLGEYRNYFLSRVPRPPNQVEPVSRQTQIERLL